MSNPIKILYTIPNFETAGSGKALLNIAVGLDKSRFEPHIMCMHDRGEFFETVRRSGVPFHIFPYVTKMRPILKGLLGCWKKRRKFKEIGPDIVHSFHYSADYSEALAVRMSATKWVFSKKNMNWGGSSKNAWLLRSRLANRIIIQNTDMAEKFYPNSRKTRLIPRGVDTAKYDPGPRDSFKQSERSTITCVANLVPVKGVEVLLEAFRILEPDHPNWELKIVGDDTSEYGKELKDRFSKLIGSGSIRFTGRVLDVVSELASSDIFVLSTLGKGEGSPVSLLEAMSMGLPVLGSKIPGIKDQLSKFEDEFMFTPGNSSELAQKLERLMNLSHDERRSIGNKLRDYCIAEWDISREVRRHENFYLETLGL